jgi:calcineurin-like phosphoesterase family protein|tara:strand:+ start:1583 stop:2137 length:555 start_codon:yes stop_codon:yes gene_type:complete
MRDIWIISDTHFRHENILKFSDTASGKLIRGNRFTDVDEMDEHMIERWNSVVKQGDIVYHLGDVLIGDKEWFKKNWPRLNGSKRLTVGNHDDIKFLCSGGFFQKVYETRQFSEFGLILSHRPLELGNLLKKKDRSLPWVKDNLETLLNVHGHIHQNPSPEGPYKNVSVEAINYTPVHIEDLRVK